MENELAALLASCWEKAVNGRDPYPTFQEGCFACGKNGKLHLFQGFRDVDIFVAAKMCQKCYVELVRRQREFYELTGAVYRTALLLGYELGKKHQLQELHLRLDRSANGGRTKN